MALAAKDHGAALATRDARARGTYDAVGAFLIWPPLRAAAANGSNRIVLGSPRSLSINTLTCLDDPCRPSCRSFASRGAGLDDQFQGVGCEDGARAPKISL